MWEGGGGNVGVEMARFLSVDGRLVWAKAPLAGRLRKLGWAGDGGEGRGGVGWERGGGEGGEQPVLSQVDVHYMYMYVCVCVCVCVYRSI